jgi:hypothetical protein
MAGDLPVIVDPYLWNDDDDDEMTKTLSNEQISKCNIYHKNRLSL